jgi:hypothetical protein
VSTRHFDPPLTTDEVTKVYEITTWVLNRLGLPTWRMQIQTTPGGPKVYAAIRPMEDKHVGELSLGTHWMRYSREEKTETVVHECVHLIHHRLSALRDDAYRYMGSDSLMRFQDLFSNGIEMMTDHITQLLLGLLGEELGAMAKRLWPDEEEPTP